MRCRLLKNLNTFADLLGDFSIPDFPKEVPGKELAEILANGLSKQGYKVLNIEGTDIAHYIQCESGGQNFDIMVTIDDVNNPSRWQILSSLKIPFRFHCFKRAQNEAYKRLLLAIDETLCQSSKVHDVRWFPQFESPDRLLLWPPSESPIRDPSLHRKLPLILHLDQCLSDFTSTVVRLSFVLIVSFSIFYEQCGFLIVPVLVALALVVFVLPMLISVYISVLARRKKEKKSLARKP